jgi:hypothetical protein
MVGEPDPHRDPQWLRDAWRGFVHEWLSYARTAWRVTRAPGQFMRAWADGDEAALNPLACIVNALAVAAAITAGRQLLFHSASNLPSWLELFAPALQIFNSALIASLMHFPLRLLGGRRPWRTSMAATLFVTSGPLLPLYVARNLLMEPMSLTQPPANVAVLAAVGLLIMGAMATYLVLTLSAAHRLPLWRALVALLIIGLFFALLIAALRALFPALT